MDIVFQAIFLGFLLSLVLIGPAFFLLIETSLTKGWKAAITLDLGVIFADILCISVAYFGAKDLFDFIQTHPSLYKVGGFIVFIYGLFMYFSKPKLHINSSVVVSHNYFKTFMNGFGMNLINIGIVMFWFVVVGSVSISYPEHSQFLLFMGIALTTFFGIDLAKIFLAGRFQEKMTDKLVYKIRRFVGIALAIFGIIIFLKGFFSFDKIEQVLPETPFTEELSH